MTKSHNPGVRKSDFGYVTEIVDQNKTNDVGAGEGGGIELEVRPEKGSRYFCKARI